MVWANWELSRIIVLLTGAAYLMISFQVSMFHSRQNFRHLAMWGPVLAGPITGLGAILLATINTRWLLTPVLALFWLDTVDGLIGFYYHFRGVGQRVEGFVWRNFLVGPPIVLPLMFAALSVFGLLALYWR